jgi:hypothetical protein
MLRKVDRTATSILFPAVSPGGSTPVIPDTQEVETRELKFQFSQGKKLVRSYFKKKPSMVVHTCNTGSFEAEVAEPWSKVS